MVLMVVVMELIIIYGLVERGIVYPVCCFGFYLHVVYSNLEAFGCGVYVASVF